MSEHNPKSYWCECEQCTGSTDWIPSPGPLWPPRDKDDLTAIFSDFNSKIYDMHIEIDSLEASRNIIRKDLKELVTKIEEQGKKLAELIASNELTITRLNEELEAKEKLIKNHRFSDI